MLAVLDNAGAVLAMVSSPYLEIRGWTFEALARRFENDETANIVGKMEDRRYYTKIRGGIDLKRGEGIVRLLWQDMMKRGSSKYVSLKEQA